MADEYADNLADSYVRTHDAAGDTMGTNFNGGVVAMPLAAGEVRAPISGEIRDTVGNRRSDEDPLFTSIAGDSKEFVHGMPKATWDSLSPEDKQKWEVPEEQFSHYRGLGTAAGAAPGLVIATLPGMQLPGGLLGAYGGSQGYDAADNWLKNQSQVTTREELNRQFEATRGKD
ncbi:hypothetical protein [Fundidesulfovibrio terrae]|uniref:hypothetical protein n=1 Tax=Fundidesulfovibrio terrae TaxID=2922866 RepID=UPI001FAFA2AD|nr:hypothetical protein [Fundidesulfovibrio terrae]